ncbi:YqzE family protein [Paenibacillus caui]|uniref:YqzE family protein n=1 Tax=Paenibacillus caui TaxID=2873927 RepID=UPI001CA8CC6A|nr:YqzE family protein [Paenibacillus caui]
MAKGDELVRYITEKVVTYVETPKEIRRERRQVKEHWSSKWFGMIPLSLSLWWQRAPFKRKTRIR